MSFGDGNMGSRTSMLQHAAAACLATAIISSSIPAGASVTEFSAGSDAGRNDVLKSYGVSTVLILSKEESRSSLDPSALDVAPSETKDVPGLVAELRGATKSDRLLGTMIKINQMVEDDTEGLAEDPFAKEVGR